MRNSHALEGSWAEIYFFVTALTTLNREMWFSENWQHPDGTQEKLESDVVIQSAAKLCIAKVWTSEFGLQVKQAFRCIGNIPGYFSRPSMLCTVRVQSRRAHAHPFATRSVWCRCRRAVPTGPVAVVRNASKQAT